MRNSFGLLSLPASLLLLIANTPAHTSSQDLQWPYNLPPHAKYFPEDEHVVRRDLEVQNRLAHQMPAGVQKMSGDEGEKFLMTYWRFDSTETGQNIPIPRFRGRAAELGESDLWTNATISQPLQPPFLLHTDEQTSLNPHFSRFLRFPRGVLNPSHQKRDFQCPSGTSSCTALGRPDSCCATGETCQLVTDTGLGDVGCCGQGITCSGQVSFCDEGYKSCPNNPGGGCCIPGYSCAGTGCAASSTATVIITPTVTAPRSTSTSSATPTTSASSSATLIAPVASSSSSTSTTTTTAPSSNRPQAPLTCSPGFQSCPATLGGGCCPTDRACGATECPASSPSSPTGSNTFVQATPSPSTSTSTSTNNPAAPVRPTSIVSTATTGPTTGTESSSTITGTACPTGFYQCSAYYRGGCCRVGRDCGVTSCPTAAASESVAVVDSNGVTVLVAPTGSGSNTGGGSSVSVTAAPSTTTTIATGTGPGPATASANANANSGTASVSGSGICAQGWFNCGSSGGGGCCPSGYVCGTSCTASATGTGAGAGGGSVGKIAASDAAASVRNGKGVRVAVVVGVGVVGFVWLAT